MSETPPNTVKETGAAAGDVLVGIHTNGNALLIVKVFEAQPPDVGGRLKGAFRVLDEGKGKYAKGIRSVIDDNAAFAEASDFIHLVASQEGCEDCTHILNLNALRKLDLILSGELPGQEIRSETISERVCLKCSRVYTDLSLNFCLEDGSSLISRSLEFETVISANRKPHSGPGISNARSARSDFPGFEFIRAAVAKFPNLSIKVHQGNNHRIMKQGHTGSIWIVPRHGGVSITANGQAAQRLYREMERLLGPHHRVDEKGYRYFQADDPMDVERVIKTWSEI